MLETLLETEALETGETKEQGSESAALSVSGLLEFSHIEASYAVRAVFKRKNGLSEMSHPGILNRSWPF